MIDNYIEKQYEPWHKVYQDVLTKNCIYLGDIGSAMNLEFIRQNNIKTVVTAAYGMEHVTFEKDIHHIVYPILDSKAQNISKLFLKFIELIDQQLNKGNILVHCFAGVSRSATLVIAYIMKKHDLSFKQAIDQVRKIRSSVCPNYGFQMQLKLFEKHLKQKDKQSRFERRKNSKTSQSDKKTRINYNANIELPQIGNNFSINSSSYNNQNKIEFRPKIVIPSMISFPQTKSSKLKSDKQDELQQIIKKKPVLKPRSLSHAQRKMNQKKAFKKIAYPNEAKVFLLTKFKLNQNNFLSEKVSKIHPKIFANVNYS